MVPEYFIQSVSQVMCFLETQNVSKIDGLQEGLNFVPDIRAAEDSRVPSANAQGTFKFGWGDLAKLVSTEEPTEQREDEDEEEVEEEDDVEDEPSSSGSKGSPASR